MRYSSNWYIALAFIVIIFNIACAIGGVFAFIDFIDLVF